MTRKFQPRVQGIQSATGENLTEAAQIADRWKGLVQVKTCTAMREEKELNMSIGRKSLHHFVQRLLVPSTRQQVAKPQVLMRSEQNCSKQERRYWTECTECAAIWETGEWPEEWTFSMFIPLTKKGDLKQCDNYRTIALVSHASKILLRIILERIRVKTETEIADDRRDSDKERGLAGHAHLCRR